MIVLAVVGVAVGVMIITFFSNADLNRCNLCSREKKSLIQK